jgi:hypothetical protein
MIARARTARNILHLLPILTILLAVSPVLGQGFMYGARTNKSQYDLGEVIYITIYHGSVTDLCMYHTVKCDVYYAGDLVASYGPWNDSEISFPRTVSFTPTQTGNYTIIVKCWHQDGREEKEFTQVPVRVNVIPEFPSILPVVLCAMVIVMVALRKNTLRIRTRPQRLKQ